MLDFIRKYQQLFLGVIASIVIFSMLFFGTFSVLSTDEKPKEDPLVAKTVDGAPFYFSDVKDLARFLASDREERSVSPNLCNDGVIRHDLISSGLAEILVANYFEGLKLGFESRLDKAKKFKSYAHPSIPGLSASALWQRFLPAINEEIDLLKQEETASLKTFASLSNLYKYQGYFPPDTLRQFLLMQQNQNRDVPFDSQLQYRDLSLFGFHSISDWFGSDFLDLAAQFVLNGASLAEQKGYKVSLEEAKGDLALIYEGSIKQLQAKGVQNLPSLSEHLRSLGFDVKSAAKVWRKVLLFRRYFQGISSAAFIDRLPFSDFASYAKETALVDLYQWPSSFQLRTMNDLIEFQAYLSMIAPPLKNPLDLPTHFFSMEAIQAKCPELVPEQYRIRYKETSLQQVGLKASMAQVLDWQLDEKNWSLLQRECDFLLKLPKSTRKERFHILETLDAKNRLAVDQLARSSLAASHPEWIQESVLSAPAKEKLIFVTDAVAVLPHVRDTARFASLLRASSQGDALAAEALQTYFDNEKDVYSVEIVETLPRSVLTFEQAKEAKVLSKVADRVLENHYLKMGAANPAKFQNKKGDWVSLSEVKEIVAKDFFSDLFAKIASLEKKEWTDADYPRYRLLFPARLGLEDIKNNGEQSPWLLKGDDPLRAQFAMEKRASKIERTMQQESPDAFVFTMEPSSWSAVQVAPNGEVKFFYLSEKQSSQEPILEQMSFGKAALGLDAQRYICEKFLQSIQAKQSIVIPLQGESE